MPGRNSLSNIQFQLHRAQLVPQFGADWCAIADQPASGETGDHAVAACVAGPGLVRPSDSPFRYLDRCAVCQTVRRQSDSAAAEYEPEVPLPQVSQLVRRYWTGPIG